MKILISNDDGVAAPGIAALAEALSSIAEIIVMAPDRNRSGASNSLTLSRPLRVRSLDNGFYSVEGTPTDCVHLALTGYFKDSIDMVVSGINQGANLGDDILYSGTVAAAMEGRSLGLPAIAVSMVGESIHHYQTGAQIIKEMVMQLSKVGHELNTILNVNIPDKPRHELQGIQITRLGSRHIAAPIIEDVDPRGHQMYWIGLPGPEADAGIGTDFFAIKQNFVSVTPLHLDMTHYKAFDKLSEWMQGVQLE